MDRRTKCITSSTGSLGQMFEKAGKHAFADMWMGGVRSAVYGGDMSPVGDMISGALSSVGNGYIDDGVDNIVLKIVSSAVLGGTISEIGGGKFANGAISAAYSMLFNEMKHKQQVKKTKNYENAIRTFLKEAVPGTKYTADQLTEFGIPSDVKKLVKSFTVNSHSSISVDWDNGGIIGKAKFKAIEALSPARLTDGIINVDTSGHFLIITGGAIRLKHDGQIYNTIYMFKNNVSFNKKFDPAWGL